mgnify:CR=1 FL=1
MNVPFIKPQFPNPSDIADDLEKIYNNNFYSNNGPFYEKFKQEIQSYLGNDLQAVITSSATSALMIAIKGIFGERTSRKKYVAVPSFTFAASPLAIHWCGYEPLFFDIEVDSGQPSIESFKKINRRYRNKIAGVVLVNNFGIGMSNLHAWQQYLNSQNLLYIIDSAPGFGSIYPNGDKLGGGGLCEVFSFHATKPFGIGEGGLITTKNKKLATKLESLKNFGFNKDKDVVNYGINAKITELDCAIGRRVLKMYDKTLDDRRTTYRLFERYLGESVEFLPRADTASIQFATIIVSDNVRRKNILHNLKKSGVEARTYYAPAVHKMSIFRNAKKGTLSNTETLSERVISLPVHHGMSKQLIEKICKVIRES